MYKRILMAFDGSDTSRKALVSALELARASHGRVRIVHLVEPLAHLTGFEPGSPALQALREYAQKTLVTATDLAAAAQVPADTRLLDKPGLRLADAVAQEAADFEADLVVVGTHGRRGIERALLGSDAEQVIRQAPVPVLVVRHATQPA